MIFVCLLMVDGIELSDVDGFSSGIVDGVGLVSGNQILANRGPDSRIVFKANIKTL